MIIQDMGLCIYYPIAMKHSICLLKWKLNWNEELEFFALIEAMNIYQICSKSFVKGKEYNGSSQFHTLHNKTVLRSVGIKHCLTWSSQ